MCVGDYPHPKPRKQQALWVEELSDCDLAALEQSKVPTEYRVLDNKLADN